jgi:hypothetical protein
MLFEGFLRKRKISPFYLELISYLITTCAEVVIFFSLLLSFLYLYFVNDRNTIPILFFGLAVMMISMPLLLIGLNFNAVKQGIYSRRKDTVVFSSRDHMIVDYWVEHLLSTYESYKPLYSCLYLFFAEPYIYKIAFLTFPKNQNVIPAKELKFYAPPHWSYRFRKDYRRYKDEFMASGFEDMKCRPLYTPGNLRDAKKYGGKDYEVYYMYMTYEKAQVFNRLFELVDPPEFRITTYEKSEVLISLEPIAGKEYPLEALECMEKINAMYP